MGDGMISLPSCVNLQRVSASGMWTSEIAAALSSEGFGIFSTLAVLSGIAASFGVRAGLATACCVSIAVVGPSRASFPGCDDAMVYTNREFLPE